MTLLSISKKLANATETESKFVLTEFHDVESFSNELKKDAVSSAKLIVDFNEHIISDESALVELDNRFSSILKDWKGDFEEELKAHGNSEEMKKIKGIFGGFLELEKNLETNVESLNRQFEEVRTLLKDVDFSRQKMTDIFRGLINNLKSVMELDLQLKKHVEELNEVVRLNEYKTHKLKNYKRILGADAETMNDLLLGRKYYARYDLQDRANLWNRWAKSTNQNKIVGLNANNVDLSGFVFDGFIFEKSTFVNAKLTGASFVGANLTNTNFSGADLFFANFSKAILDRVNFANADLQKVDFEGAHMHSAILLNALLQKTNFDRSDLKGAKFLGKDLGSEVNFEENRIVHMFEGGEELLNTSFENAINTPQDVEFYLHGEYFVRGG